MGGAAGGDRTHYLPLTRRMHSQICFNGEPNTGTTLPRLSLSTLLFSTLTATRAIMPQWFGTSIRGAEQKKTYVSYFAPNRLAKTDPMKSGVRCLHEQTVCLRRERDLNPRWAQTHSCFQDRCIQPLCHLSYKFSTFTPTLTIPAEVRNLSIEGHCS
jgi:hypothetical protein